MRKSSRGEQRSVTWTSTMTSSLSLDDYPPGTPLPEPRMPDLSGVPGPLRWLMQRRVRKMRAGQRIRLEQARDDYFRRKADGESPTP
jgi:hypothetical protein